MEDTLAGKCANYIICNELSCLSLSYMKARWMDPETGRFISPDPAKDGINYYVYCSNNPTTMVDPSGLTDITAEQAMIACGVHTTSSQASPDSYIPNSSNTDYDNDGTVGDLGDKIIQWKMDHGVYSWITDVYNPYIASLPNKMAEHGAKSSSELLGYLNRDYEKGYYSPNFTSNMSYEEYMAYKESMKFGTFEYNSTSNYDLPFRFDKQLPFKPINYKPVTLIGNKIPYVYGATIYPYLPKVDPGNIYLIWEALSKARDIVLENSIYAIDDAEERRKLEPSIREGTFLDVVMTFPEVQNNPELLDAIKNNDITTIEGIDVIWDVLKSNYGYAVEEIVTEKGKEMMGRGVAWWAIGLSYAKDFNKVSNVTNKPPIKSVKDILRSVKNFEQLKGGVQQGFIKGNAQAIFDSLTKGAEQLKSGAYKLSDGTIINLYNATSTGVSTISINQAGNLFKIRVE